MSDPITPPAPAAAPEPTPDPNVAELASLRQKVADLQSREGRFRNEKGVMAARIRELEQLALGNQTGEPEFSGQPSITQPPAPPAYNLPQGYQGGFQPQDVVTREEWDLDRFRREVNSENRFNAIRDIAQSSRVSSYIKYRPGPYGQAVPDVYGTYRAIADSMELEELRKAQAGAPQSRNPALGTISGSGAASGPEVVDLDGLTPEQIKEKFPEAFAPSGYTPKW